MKSDVRRTANEAEKPPSPLSENGLSLKESGSTPAPTGPGRGSRCDGAPHLRFIPAPADHSDPTADAIAQALRDSLSPQTGGGA